MQRQIQKLAAGKFEDDLPIIRLEPDKLELSVTEHTVYEGTFLVESDNEVPLRGVIYSSHPRLKIVNPVFSGVKNNISYTVDATDLTEGDLLKGEVCVVCAFGEFVLDFSAAVSRRYYPSDDGEIRDISQFLALASHAYHEAYTIFSKPDFANIFHEENVREKLLYDALSAGRNRMAHTYDEFLIGCGVKKRMEFYLPKEEGVYEFVTDSRKECIMLRRDGENYIEIEISARGDFITLEKSVITAEDFIGSTVEVPFYLHAQAMHRGVNRAEILFKTPFSEYTYTIYASTQEVKRPTKLHDGAVNGGRAETADGSDGRMRGDLTTHEVRKLKAQLTRMYMDYRLNRNTTGEWVRETNVRIDRLMEIDDSGWYLLYKAQTLIINRQIQDATWLMDSFRRKYELSDPELHAYYNYLTTLLDKDPDFIKAQTEEIKRLHAKHRDSYRILWTLLFLDPDLERNKARKLSVIRAQIVQGDVTPYLFLEAVYLMDQDPYLVTELDDFVLRCLTWAMRRQCINIGLAGHIARLGIENRATDDRLLPILFYMANLYPEDEIITAICTCLIRSGKYGPEYYSWFKAGMDRNIRVSMLNEYYLMSTESIGELTVPRSLMLYFSYQCQVNDETCAKLLSFVIRNKTKDPQLYESYRRQILSFAQTKLRQRVISEELRDIYEDYIQNNLISKELAEDFCRVLFTKRIAFDKDYGMDRIVAVSGGLKEEMKAPVRDKVAYISMPASDTLLLWEDDQGRRFVIREEFSTESLMVTYKYARNMLSVLAGQPFCLVHYFDKRNPSVPFLPEDMTHVYRLLMSDAVREPYKLSMISEVFDYYKKNITDDLLEEYLLAFDIGKLSAAEKAAVIEIFIEQGYMMRAWQFVETYGAAFVSAVDKILLADFMITETESAYRPELVALCTDIFFEGKYNEDILKYLLLYYHGPTKQMASIWKVCQIPDTNATRIHRQHQRYFCFL